MKVDISQAGTKQQQKTTFTKTIFAPKTAPQRLCV